MHKRLAELKYQRDEILKQIREFKDGFTYRTVTYSYGSETPDIFNNSVACTDYCNHYNGDNGMVHIYTDNPDMQRRDGVKVHPLSETPNFKMFED